MTDDRRIAVGLPAHSGAHLAEAIESLLVQDLPISIVVTDERTDTSVKAITVAYQRDFGDRLQYYPNQERLGMVGNWRRAFVAARKFAPDAPYFAWASDHDVWHPRWSLVLSRTLDRRTDAVVAYPLAARLSSDHWVSKPLWLFETDPRRGSLRRFVDAQLGMSAGNMVYGLFRAEAVERAHVFRPVLLPDRLLLAELALYGAFVQADELLWYRRFAHKVTLDRQRNSLFVGQTPRSARMPWWLSHSMALARSGHLLPGAVTPALGLWLDTRRRLRLIRRWWINNANASEGRAVRVRRAALAVRTRMAR